MHDSRKYCYTLLDMRKKACIHEKPLHYLKPNSNRLFQLAFVFHHLNFGNSIMLKIHCGCSEQSTIFYNGNKIEFKAWSLYTWQDRKLVMGNTNFSRSEKNWIKRDSGLNQYFCTATGHFKRSSTVKHYINRNTFYIFEKPYS